MLSYGSIAVARVQHRVMVVQGTYTNKILLLTIDPVKLITLFCFLVNSVATTRQV